MKSYPREFLFCTLLLAACGGDGGDTGATTTTTTSTTTSTTNVDPCADVTCDGHGTCVLTEGQAECDCAPGYHPEGLSCVEDANAAPVITTTPATDATVLVEYLYEVACTDADADVLTISVGDADTCDATFVDHGDGTADYRFTAPADAAGTSCTLDLLCSDGVASATQTVDVGISAGECLQDETFTGQIYVPDPPDAASSCGGLYVSGAFPADFDAEVGTLRALLPATSGVSAAVDVTLTGAAVTAVGNLGLYVDFWLADGAAAVKMWTPGDATQLPPFPVRVGQRVSVHVLELLNYDGEAEITQVEEGSWSLDSEDAEVYVVDRTGGPDLTLADVDQVVRLTGTVTSAGTECGNGFFCYDLDYGASAPVTFRPSDASLPLGLCLSWVGPLSAASDQIQLRLYNSDWVVTH